MPHTIIQEFALVSINVSATPPPHVMFVWQPHMEMIESLSLVQMSHLSHTCLLAVTVAKAIRAARRKHLLLTSSLGGLFVC